MASIEQSKWLILIVEDDPLIGMMLQDMLLDLECASIGPAGSVTAALKVIAETRHLDGALLDCNLGGDKVWPVADELVARNIPFVFSTGYGVAGVERRFALRPVLAKPFNLDKLRTVLMPQLKLRQPC